MTNISWQVFAIVLNLAYYGARTSLKGLMNAGSEYPVMVALLRP